MSPTRQSGNQRSSDCVPGEDRRSRPEPAHGGTILRRCAHDADLGTGPAAYGLANHVPHDVAVAQDSDDRWKSQCRQDLQVEIGQPRAKRQRAEGGNIKILRGLQVWRRQELSPGQHPDRQPAEVKPRTGSSWRCLPFQCEISDRGRQLTSHHCAQRGILAQNQDAPQPDRRGQTGQPHGERAIVPPQRPGQDRFARRNVDPASRHGRHEALAAELPVCGCDRVAVHPESLAHRPDAGQFRPVRVAAIADPGLEP